MSFANMTKSLTAKHGQETAVNNLPHGRDVIAVFPTGFGQSMIFTVFHCLRLPDKNCCLQEPVLLLFRC